MYEYPVYAWVRCSQEESEESRDYIQKAETQTALHSKRTSGAAISRQSPDTLSLLLFASVSIPNTRDRLVSTRAPCSFPVQSASRAHFVSHTQILSVSVLKPLHSWNGLQLLKKISHFSSLAHSPSALRISLALSLFLTHALASFFSSCARSLSPLFSLSLYLFLFESSSVCSVSCYGIKTQEVVQSCRFPFPKKHKARGASLR